jgi:hypothetical protein
MREPTPIQRAAIPPLLAGRDLVAPRSGRAWSKTTTLTASGLLWSRSVQSSTFSRWRSPPSIWLAGRAALRTRKKSFPRPNCRRRTTATAVQGQSQGQRTRPAAARRTRPAARSSGNCGHDTPVRGDRPFPRTPAAGSCWRYHRRVVPLRQGHRRDRDRRLFLPRRGSRVSGRRRIRGAPAGQHQGPADNRSPRTLSGTVVVLLRPPTCSRCALAGGPWTVFPGAPGPAGACGPRP